jgi:hypothetical protein
MFRRRAPRENPADTIIRYAKAIDEHLNEATAPVQQITDYLELNGIVAQLREAIETNQSCVKINILAGLAIGECQRYAAKYNVTVPDATSKN